jgi:hypothetical protein
MKNDNKYYKKLPNNLSVDEYKNIFVNCCVLCKLLRDKYPEFKKETKTYYNINYKKYIKFVTCECCGKEMSNTIYITHKKTNKYKINMENKRLKEELKNIK